MITFHPQTKKILPRSSQIIYCITNRLYILEIVRLFWLSPQLYLLRPAFCSYLSLPHLSHKHTRQPCKMHWMWWDIIKAFSWNTQFQLLLIPKYSLQFNEISLNEVTQIGCWYLFIMVALQHKDALCTKWKQEMLLSEISKTTNGISLLKSALKRTNTSTPAEIYTNTHRHKHTHSAQMKQAF